MRAIVTGDTDQAERFATEALQLGTDSGQPDAALFFASDDSAFVTGTDLLVDGGLSAGMIVPGQPGT